MCKICKNFEKEVSEIGVAQTEFLLSVVCLDDKDLEYVEV